MNSLYNAIDKQIELNKGINLFCEDEILLRFTEGFVQKINKVKEQDDVVIDSLIQYSMDKVLEEFYRVNQYYNFTEQSKKDLRAIYSGLFDSIKGENVEESELSIKHCHNLRLWLQTNNPFAEKIYPPHKNKVDTVPCFEYSPDLQLDLLQIDLSSIAEPVLDIGCGKNANLVKYLRQNDIIAFGIDRYPTGYSCVRNTDWLDYDYGKMRWGTIISNLGFSNHFLHHHLRQDGDYLMYARKYMQIIGSLKVGGSFHYAPDLPFIEQYLDRKEYKIGYAKQNRDDVRSVIITRLR